MCRAPGGAGGGRRRLSAVSNFPGDVQSREQRKFRSGPAAEPLPTSCPPRQGRGKEAQRCPPPAPPARLGTMGSRRKKFGVRGRGGGPSRALSFCLGTSSPRRLRETGWDEGGGGGLRLTSHPSKRRKCGGDAQRRGVPLGAAGGARRTGWQRRAVPSRLSGRLLLLLRGGGVSCGGGARRSRGQPEPGRRGVGAAPSATQRPRPGAHGDAGGEGAAGTSPRPPTLPTERVGRAPPYPPRTPQPPRGEERGGGKQQLPSLQLSDHHAPGAAPSSLSAATRCSQRLHLIAVSRGGDAASLQGSSRAELTATRLSQQTVQGSGKTRSPALQMSQQCLPNRVSPLRAQSCSFPSPDLPAGSGHSHASFRDNHALCQHSTLHLLGESSSARAATEHRHQQT